LVEDVFKELAPTDLFGLICLNGKRGIILEEKQLNFNAKNYILTKDLKNFKTDVVNRHVDVT
jgi:hypothetical protein